MIGVIDYRTGNSRSVSHALRFLGIKHVLVSRPDEALAASATHYVLPGVGAAGTTMTYLQAEGWIDFLTEEVVKKGSPYLGICVGLQVLFERSAEQDAECLGWFPGDVASLDSTAVRVPHIGWNDVVQHRSHDALNLSGSELGSQFYFVNSYFARPADATHIVASTRYGVEIPAVVAADNIMATQFHAEKSGAAGLEILRNFAPQG